MKEAFEDWWDAPIDMTGNPFRQDCAAYWAWEGWKAAAAAERDKYEAKFKQLEALMQAREQQPNKPCCLAERKAIEPIVYGLCISDNNAQEIVDAIRKRGQE